MKEMIDSAVYSWVLAIKATFDYCELSNEEALEQSIREIYRLGYNAAKTEVK